MRYLGVDFGEKRIGLAVSDEDGRVATPHSTLARRSDAQAIGEIRRLVADEEIGRIVVGEPRGPEGRIGTAASRARSFARKLAGATGLPVRMADETLSSREAVDRMARPPRDPSRLDALAAQLILQQALDARLDEGRIDPEPTDAGRIAGG
jgi:putative Holliday junction resolvase